MVKDKNGQAFAVISSGGKQYLVREGDTVEVELLDVEPGALVEFPVLFFNNGSSATVGAPRVEGVTVTGELLDFTKGPKISSIKYKPSHHQYRKFGHRQRYARLKIKEFTEHNKASDHKKKHQGV